MGTHELKIISGKPRRVCSECESTKIEYDEDCCATWCFNCNDWAGGEIDRLIALNHYDDLRPLNRYANKNTLTGRVETNWAQAEADEYEGDLPSGLL